MHGSSSSKSLKLHMAIHLWFDWPKWGKLKESLPWHYSGTLMDGTGLSRIFLWIKLFPFIVLFRIASEVFVETGRSRFGEKIVLWSWVTDTAVACTIIKMHILWKSSLFILDYFWSWEKWTCNLDCCFLNVLMIVISFYFCEIFVIGCTGARRSICFRMACSSF